MAQPSTGDLTQEEVDRLAAKAEGPSTWRKALSSEPADAAGLGAAFAQMQGGAGGASGPARVGSWRVWARCCRRRRADRGKRRPCARSDRGAQERRSRPDPDLALRLLDARDEVKRPGRCGDVGSGARVDRVQTTAACGAHSCGTARLVRRTRRRGRFRRCRRAEAGRPACCATENPRRHDLVNVRWVTPLGVETASMS